MPPIPVRTNPLAILSAIAAALTFSSFCIGVAPIPLTAWVCYPSAFILGLLASATGFIALRQIRTSVERGRRLALFGLFTGILTILAVLCVTSLSLALVYFGRNYINAIWPAIKP